MQTYLGVKVVGAEPEPAPVKMGEYEAGTEGYKIIYPDGYISWSPKEVFEEAYRPIDKLTLGLAKEAMNKGKKVARAGWNGKDMFIFKVPGSTFKVSRPPLLGIFPEGTEVNYHSHIDMKTADGQIVPWLCSQTDMEAEDWMIVE